MSFEDFIQRGLARKPTKNNLLIISVVIIVIAGLLFWKVSAKGTGATVNTNTKTGIAVGDLASDFTLTDMENGKQITRDSFEGKPVLIHFFASWCPRCSHTASNVAPYDDATGGNAFNVLLVSIDPRMPDSDLLRFKQQYGREDWIVTKINGKIENDYQVRSLDTKYLLDEGGIIRHTDAQTWDYNEAKQIIGGVL